MKKEICAAAVLLCVLAALILNSHYLSKLTGSVEAAVRDSQKYALRGDWAEAETAAETAAAIWNGSEKYTHIFMNHSEIDLTASTLHGLLVAVYTRSCGTVKGAAEAALYSLEDVSEMESLHLGSVF